MSQSQWKRIEPKPAAVPAPVSPAKLEANRANAQLSTGPRTEEGRARSSQNARTHGLTARELVIRPEDRAEFDELLASYTAELKPHGALEHTLFNQLIHAAWNLRRVRILEAELFDGEIDPLLDEQNEAKLDRFARYAQRFERSLYRAITELRKLQTERVERHTLPRIVAKALPLLATGRKLDLAERTQSRAVNEAIDAKLAELDQEMASYVRSI